MSNTATETARTQIYLVADAKGPRPEILSAPGRHPWAKLPNAPERVFLPRTVDGVTMKRYFDGFPDERSAALQAVIMGRGEVITLEQFNELMLADVRGEIEAEGYVALQMSGADISHELAPVEQSASLS